MRLRVGAHRPPRILQRTLDAGDVQRPVRRPPDARCGLDHALQDCALLERELRLLVPLPLRPDVAAETGRVALGDPEQLLLGHRPLAWIQALQDLGLPRPLPLDGWPLGLKQRLAGLERQPVLAIQRVGPRPLVLGGRFVDRREVGPAHLVRRDALDHLADGRTEGVRVGVGRCPRARDRGRPDLSVLVLRDRAHQPPPPMALAPVPPPPPHDGISVPSPATCAPAPSSPAMALFVAAAFTCCACVAKLCACT